MPGPLDYLKGLFNSQYNVPDLSPEAQAEQDARATAMQENDPSLNSGWQKAGRGAIDAIAGLARGVTGIGDQGPAGKTWANAGALGAAVLPIAGPLGKLGMFSRVDKVASELPEFAHPNKIISAFKNQANPEEVNFRGLGDFLAGKGNNRVSKAEVLSHLEKNPAPQLDMKTLGPSNVTSEGPRGWNWDRENQGTVYHDYQMPGGTNYKENLISFPSEKKPTGEFTHHSMEAYDPTKGARKSSGYFIDDALNDAAARAENRIPGQGGEPDEFFSPDLETNMFGSQHNPDIEAGNRLNNLPSDPFGYPPETLAKGIYQHNSSVGYPSYAKEYADRFGFDPVHSEPIMKDEGWFGPHFGNEPNLAVYTRTQERNLLSPGDTGQWGPQHFSGGEDMSGIPPDEDVSHLTGGEPFNREFKFNRNIDNQSLSGFGPTRDEALRDLIDAHNKGDSYFKSSSPPNTGEKVLNVEGVQSDLNQTGASTGYGVSQADPNDLADLRVAAEARDRAFNNYNDMRSKYADLSTDEFYAHPTADEDVSRAYQAYQDAENMHHNLETLMPDTGNGPPDNAFKKDWPKLGAKQILLDAANDPSITGITITPGSELIKRGEGYGPRRLGDPVKPKRVHPDYPLAAQPQFNDETLPNEFKKLLTPFGGGNPDRVVVGQGKSPITNWTAPNLHNPEGSLHGALYDPLKGEPVLSGLLNTNFDDQLYRPRPGEPVDRYELARYFDKYASKPQVTAPRFVLTPKMKEQIKKGLPLLSIMGLANAQPQSNSEGQ